MMIKEVIEKIIHTCDVPPLSQNCDLLITGNWNWEVTGMVTTFMATVDVIKEAVEKSANLIITHEPIFYTSTDETDWLIDDEVYSQKQKLIEENKISIWRFHDHMHMTKPDLIYAGIEKQLGWNIFRIPDMRHCYKIPSTTLQELSAFLKDKLNVKLAQIVGEEDSTIERVGLLVGGGSLGLGSEKMPMELMRNENLDVIICGEIFEWTLCAYVRDASQLGLNKSLIILGHNRTEEAGMHYLQEWLKPLFPDIPVWFCEAGEPISYL